MSKVEPSSLSFLHSCTTPRHHRHHVMLRGPKRVCIVSSTTHRRFQSYFTRSWARENYTRRNETDCTLFINFCNEEQPQHTHGAAQLGLSSSQTRKYIHIKSDRKCLTPRFPDTHCTIFIVSRPIFHRAWREKKTQEIVCEMKSHRCYNLILFIMFAVEFSVNYILARCFPFALRFSPLLFELIIKSRIYALLSRLIILTCVCSRTLFSALVRLYPKEKSHQQSSTFVSASSSTCIEVVICWIPLMQEAKSSNIILGAEMENLSTK